MTEGVIFLIKCTATLAFLTTNYMTKAEIVKVISDKTGINKKDTLVVVEALMDTVKETMIGGEEVFLRGFGSFIIKRRAAKPARDISKNVTVMIPEHNIPAFKPAKEFMVAMSDARTDEE